MAAPWISPTNASESAGTTREGTSRTIGAWGSGSAGDVTEIPDRGDAAPSQGGHKSRGDDDRQHEPQRAEPGALQQEYQRDRQDPDREGLQVEFAGMDESVEGADDTVSPLRFVAGEVGQLPEDDIDPDSADESHHDGVRHEPQDRTEPQKPGRQHHNAGKHRQGEQGTRRVTPGVNRRDISDDDGHGSGGLDSQEGRAGEKRATDRAEQVSVQARERADPGAQAGGEAVGNALHAEHQAGDGVLAQRVTPDREAEFHVRALVRAWTI